MKLLKLLAFTLVFFLNNVQLSAQYLEDCSWHTIKTTDQPVQRHEAAFIEAKGKFYLCGGRGIRPVSIFNPKNNVWTQGSKPPIELHHFEGISYKNNILVVGAFTGRYPHETPVPNAYVYNTKRDKWTQEFEIPKDRRRGSAMVKIHKNKLYMICGIIDGHWDGHVNWFDVYDFKTKKWTKLPNAPRARDHAASVIIDNKLYLIGGRRSSGKIKKVFHLTVPEVDVFDFKTNTWSTLQQPVPTQRAGCMAIAYGNTILFAGGESIHQKNAHSEVECYDTKTKAWSTLKPLNRGRHGSQLILYKDKVYTASGSGNRGGSPELKSIEVFKIE
ncbi:N-acetylneuraminic acid mutarotase [Wenyingzhuangia heitensis]|uniref:N-acetylneuraminic acid mutarotase n=1 Tax=Wenyingzhuangia heitensis TaxID=1487859 RepID=A0ABX0U6U0_9FLAO|nr:kelch repeat-containing protein [Wenyingzhuangia heitensis]NIJ43685.1 N-acetylneuraminic acid mutarotase [Wenyingzhuangia heitensis]